MEGINRIFFLVLGLVAVVLFFAVVTGRITLKGFLPRLTSIERNEDSATPTPTNAKTTTTAQKVSTTTQSKSTTNSSVTSSNTQTKGESITTIPETGPSALIYPMSLLLFATGIYLAYYRA
ncbi:MAG TPA: hypothetical protein VJH96_04550 [Patescibacteria group bacterium]|nr:hypothetical protein [Patescibacteria group bacterium]